MYYKDEIYDELSRLNRRLQSADLYLNLQIVGGAALIFNGINSIETGDIDTITRLEYEIREICDECSLDINDEAIDYIKNYENCEFIHDEGHSFSNINIDYLNLGGVIKTKLKNCQDEDKIEKLRYLLEDEFEIEMSVEGISSYLKELGEIPDEHDIKEFLNSLEMI